MHDDVKSVLESVRDTADFGGVKFRTINDVNALGDNALHCVCVWGDLAEVKILVENGINIHQRGEFGFTPLRVAAEFKHVAIVEYLLACGANPAALRAPEKYDAEAEKRHLCELGQQISALELQLSKCAEKKDIGHDKSEA